MNYSITWGERSVRVDYFGDIDNRDIEGAHFELNGDDRFYDCRHMILDITNCNMDKVSVSGLYLVVATDLGASRTNKTLKVAMIANQPDKSAKVRDFISRVRSHDSPWEFELFNSITEANAWLKA